MMIRTALKKSTTVRNNLGLLGLRLRMGVTARLRPHAALARAEQWFVSPPRHGLPPAEQEWLARAETQELRLFPQPVEEWSGARVMLHRWGPEAGPRVLLMHGWGGRATQMYPFIQPLLDAGYTVLGLDAPGHGQSEGHTSSLPQFIAALECLMDRPLAGVIGHSLGATAVTLGLDRGLWTERAVLIAPPLDVVDYSRQFARFIGLPEKLRRHMQERFEERLQLPWQQLDPRPAAARAGDTAALIIHDRQDREVPCEAGMSLADAWPGSLRLVTDHLGHRRILKDPRVVHAAVDFIHRGHGPALGCLDFWLH